MDCRGTDHKGILILPQDELNLRVKYEIIAWGEASCIVGELTKKAFVWRCGCQVVLIAGKSSQIHVIGDKAMEAALDACDACHIGPKDRPIFTHCQVESPLLMSLWHVVCPLAIYLSCILRFVSGG